jgi:hypothetical protein
VGGLPSWVVQDVPVNSQRNVVVTVTPSQNVDYVAYYSGDSRYTPNHSRPPLRVSVHVFVQGVLHGYYGQMGVYKLFHYHPACPQSHLGCPQFEAWVIPNKNGKRLHFILQAYGGGRWQTVSTTQNRMSDNGRPYPSASVIWIYSGPSVKGVPLRTRAFFSGDPYNEGFAGQWRYFKVTS